MGERFISKIESRPEFGPGMVERQPIDRLGELMLLLYEGKRDLVAYDLLGLEDEVFNLFRDRSGLYPFVPESVVHGEAISWGRNYGEQRLLLVDIMGEEEVGRLEHWGGELLVKRGRENRRDKRTKVKGVVVGQVLLDFYRFSLSSSGGYPALAGMDAKRLAERLNARCRNWDEESEGVNNPTPCSGEMMALILHYICTGEKADWKK